MHANATMLGRNLCLLLALLTIVANGCGYAPSPADGVQACGSGSKKCPDGYSCIDGKCWRGSRAGSGGTGTSPGTGGASPPGGMGGMISGTGGMPPSGTGGIPTSGTGGTMPDGGAGDTTPPTLEQAVRRNLELKCAKLKECKPRSFGSRYADVQACVALESRLWFALLSLPGVGFTAAVLDACSDGARAGATCEQLHASDDGPLCPVLPEPWPPRGTIENGRSCFDDLQCRSLDCTSRSATTGCGICVPLVATGGDCSRNSCDLGLRCNTEGANRICRPVRTLGSTCGPTEGECDEGLICVNGVCRKYLGRGELCGDTGYYCDSGQELFCANASKRCEPSSPPRGPGEPCATLPSGEYPVCTAGYSCINDVCVANLPAGAACDPNASNVPRCGRGFDCVSGKCEDEATFPACATTGS